MSPEAVTLTVMQGTVDTFRVSEDGRWVVQIADHGRSGTFELYAALLPDGRPRQLNVPVDVTGAVWSFELCGTAVVYRSQHAHNATTILWVVDIGGGAPRPLYEPLVAGTTVRSCRLVPGAGAVAFITSHPTAGDGLYLAPLSGRGAARHLIHTNPKGRLDADFQVTADGRYIAYVVRRSGAEADQLAVVATSGGRPRILNAHDRDVPHVGEVCVTTDNRYVLYGAEDGDGRRDLRVVAL